MKQRHATLGFCLTALTLALSGCGGPSDADLTASAKTLLESKDTRGAVIQLKNALQKNPQSAEARFLLGKALLASGDPTSALVELRKAQELQVPDVQVIPELARAMVLVGEEGRLIAQYANTKLTDPAAMADLQTSLATAYAVGNDLDKAREAIEAALSAKPGLASATILKARVKAAERDLDGALALLDQVLANDPTNDRAGLLKGDLLWQGKKDAEGALTVFTKVLASHPGSVGAHTSSIAILQELKKPDEAKALFEKLKKAAPNHPDTIFMDAQFAFQAKDYKAAREITDRLLKAAPDHVRILELAGATEYRLKNYLQAEAYLARALKNAPGLVLARQLLGQTYLRAGQPLKTIEVLQPLVEAKQPDGTSLSLVGEAWLQIGDSKKSEAAFKRATEAAPGDPRVRTSAAMAQMARGNNALAIPELEAIANEDKGPRADLALISARLRQNDADGALKAIEGLAKKMPESPLPHNLRGRVLLLKRDIPAASKSFEASLAKEANYFPSIASLAAIDFAAGKPEAARKRFEDLLKAEPNNYQALLALAELSVRTGASPLEVVKYMRDAVKLNPTQPTPHLMLVNHLLNINEPKDALTAATEAVAVLPNNLELQDALGRAQLAMNDPNQAVTTFTRLSGQQPTQAMHQVRLADAYAAQKDFAGAAKALQRALEIQPDYAPAKRSQIALAMRNGRHDEAIAMTRELQKKDPKNPGAWSVEGDIEANRKNWDAAAAAYRGAMQRRPTADYATRLHHALRMAGKTADADRAAAEWVKTNPKDPVFLYYLGDVAMAAKDLPAAEAHYRAVLAVQPRNALALNNVAWLMVKQGKPGAVALAEQANTLLPDRAPLLDTLATALAAEKNLSKAIEAQKRAIILSPQDGSLKLNLARHYIQNGEKPQAKAELDALAAMGNKFSGQAEVATLLKSL